MRSPALNAPSSQSASPKRAESWTSRSRMRSLTRGMRSSAQGLSPSSELGGYEFEDRRLHGVERGEHPGDGPRPRIGIVREQARMVLGDVEDDRAGLEQGEVAFLIGRDQAERMKAQMRGLRLRPERDEANLVGLAHLFKRPANAHIAREAHATIGRPVPGSDDDGHRETLLTNPSGCSAPPSRGRNIEATTSRIGRSPCRAVRVMRIGLGPLRELIAGRQVGCRVLAENHACSARQRRRTRPRCQSGWLPVQLFRCIR